ncbi:hypothetical protein G3M48_001176 [Beauveria asiatica]|uniref:Uncharacterized protein n=1 Tax=Beauveria asiatica TaxID=1069075 RepID=A0AAW0S0R2_9HYPO
MSINNLAIVLTLQFRQESRQTTSRFVGIITGICGLLGWASFGQQRFAVANGAVYSGEHQLFASRNDSVSAPSSSSHLLPSPRDDPQPVFCLIGASNTACTLTMCIAILSTAHPDYSLIILDNRDEFILRPTSRPHWWAHPTSGQQVLSSRDLQRAEQGTWLAVNKAGDFAVLTNYQEIVDEPTAISTSRSRGGMPSLWVGGDANESLTERVHQLVKDGGVKGVGGFSMICGRLRKNPENISIISNRADHVDDVPIVDGERGRTWGLSNTTHTNPEKWPKVSAGEQLVGEAIQNAIAKDQSETDFVESLFNVLNRDTLPVAEEEEGTVQDSMKRFRHSIFIPPVGTTQQKAEFAESAAKGRIGWVDDADTSNGAASHAPANPVGGYSSGMYGTQRQTVILVDLEGNVKYIERALFDPNGNAIERGAADVIVKFTVDGWDN